MSHRVYLRSARSREKGLGMVVLVTSAQIKPNAAGAFAQQFEQQLLSLIHAQPGFKDEMLLVVPGGPEILFITSWESHANAESYERRLWPEFTKMLANILERPVHRRFQLAHSTRHPEGSAAFPIQSPITSEPSTPGA